MPLAIFHLPVRNISSMLLAGLEVLEQDPIRITNDKARKTYFICLKNFKRKVNSSGFTGFLNLKITKFIESKKPNAKIVIFLSLLRQYVKISSVGLPMLFGFRLAFG